MCCCVVLIKITLVFQAKKLTGLTDITGCFCLDSTNSVKNIETNIPIFCAQSASFSQIMPTNPADAAAGRGAARAAPGARAGGRGPPGGRRPAPAPGRASNDLERCAEANKAEHTELDA